MAPARAPRPRPPPEFLPRLVIVLVLLEEILHRLHRCCGFCGEVALVLASPCLHRWMRCGEGAANRCPRCTPAPARPGCPRPSTPGPPVGPRISGGFWGQSRLCGDGTVNNVEACGSGSDTARGWANYCSDTSTTTSPRVIHRLWATPVGTRYRGQGVCLIRFVSSAIWL